MKDYKCMFCGYTYRPAKGDKVHDIPPGTAFATIQRWLLKK
jgi:rubredoxin